MTNIIKLEIDTDDSYTAEEKEDLLEAFLEFIQDKDPSVVEGTESIRIVSSDEVSNSDEEKVDARVIELLKTGTLSMQVSLVDKNGEEVFDTGSVPIALG